MRSRTCFAAVAFIGLGCRDATVNSAATAPAFSIVALPPDSIQTGYAGYPLSQPLRAQILVGDVPASGVAVAWSVNSGTVTPDDAESDSSGIVSAHWTLGNDVGTQVALATIQRAGRPSVRFKATALAATNVASILEESDFQVANVATTLPKSLRVLVMNNGVASAGVVVRWVATGTISSVSKTDQNGVAETEWTMPMRAGVQWAQASIDGAQRQPPPFRATALPGSVTKMVIEFGNAQTLRTNAPAFGKMGILALDEYYNGVPGLAVMWSVESGPVTLTLAGVVTNSDGRSIATVAPTGDEGIANVRATLGTATRPSDLSVVFSMRVVPVQFLVLLETNNFNLFRSSLNGTSPAIDTIPVGQTMVWQLSPFDYDEHAVESVGLPTLPGGGGRFVYGSPSEVRITFTQSGTYRYWDPFYWGTGTVVVR